MAGITLVLEASEPEYILDALEQMGEALEKHGCSLTAPARRSWFVAACGHVLVSVYPEPPRSKNNPPLLQQASSLSVLIRLEGPADGIVAVVDLVLRTAAANKVRVRPLLL